MKAFYKLSIISLVVSLTSCESCEKIEPVPPIIEQVAVSAVNLQFPSNNELCAIGELNSSDEIEILFQWTSATGAVSYRLEINNGDGGQTKIINTTATFADVNLSAASQYQWGVYAIGMSNEAKSETWNFYSQGLPENSHVPFPAVISIIYIGNSNIDIEWEAVDIDNDIAGYDIYFGSNEPPEILYENTTNKKSNSISITSGLTYYVMVVTFDTNGNSSRSKTSFVAQ